MLLCCILGQWTGAVPFRAQNSEDLLTGVIGSHHTSPEPCDFSNNFGAGHLPFFGSQPRPTGYETRTERLPVRNSHVCASLLTSGFDPAKKRARKPRVGARNKISVTPKNKLLARAARQNAAVALKHATRTRDNAHEGARDIKRAARPERARRRSRGRAGERTPPHSTKRGRPAVSKEDQKRENTKTNTNNDVPPRLVRDAASAAAFETSTRRNNPLHAEQSCEDV